MLSFHGNSIALPGGPPGRAQDCLRGVPRTHGQARSRCGFEVVLATAKTGKNFFRLRRKNIGKMLGIAEKLKKLLSGKAG